MASGELQVEERNTEDTEEVQKTQNFPLRFSAFLCVSLRLCVSSAPLRYPLCALGAQIFSA